MTDGAGFIKFPAAAVLLVCLVMVGCATSKKKSGVSEAHAFIDALYEERLAEWPVEYETEMVETTFGRTHVIKCGPVDAKPLVLLHAMGFNGLTWAPNAAELSKQYRVYAVDTIGDVGRSVVGESHTKNLEEYAQWVGELADHALAEGTREHKGGEETGTGTKDRIFVAGCSMGGWIANGAALYQPEKIEKAALISPAAGIPVKTTWGGMLISMLLNQREENIRRHVHVLLGNYSADRDWNEYMWHAFKLGGESKLSYPKKLKDSELQGTEVPVLLLVGDEEVVYKDTEMVFKRAHDNVPQVRTEYIPRAGHMGHYDNPEFVNRALIEFFSRSIPTEKL
jgi:pimeloyl-ACP methyl ester carboxylesterase